MSALEAESQNHTREAAEVRQACAEKVAICQERLDLLYAYCQKSDPRIKDLTSQVEHLMTGVSWFEKHYEEDELRSQGVSGLVDNCCGGIEEHEEAIQVCEGGRQEYGAAAVGCGRGVAHTEAGFG